MNVTVQDGWVALGANIFKLLDNIFSPQNKSYRRVLKKLKYANKANRAFNEQQRLREETPRTQSILKKIIAWELAEKRAWDKYGGL